jgi:glycosyltransferase involved in cell wall biosynthesis
VDSGGGPGQGSGALAKAPLDAMTGEVLKVLVLAGRLDRWDSCDSLAAWLDRLEGRGCQARVVCLSKGAGLTGGDPRGFELPALASRWLRGFAARWVWDHLPGDRPDLIHVVQDEMIDAAIAVAEAGRLPYIQTVADFRTLERGLRLSRRWCRHLVATSPDLAAELIAALGVPAERITVIPPGILPSPSPSPSLPRRSDAWGIPVIGTGGPLEERSGLMVFLEAARQILDAGYDAEFVIAGQGIKHPDLRRRVAQLRIDERVTVADSPALGADYWSVLDIYCQPALVACDGGTLLQAMAHAIPSIATGVPGLLSLIEPGSSGLIIPPDDPEALHAAIRELLDHPEEARRLGQNARERVRTEYNPEAQADRLVALLRQVVESGRDSDPLS